MSNETSNEKRLFNLKVVEFLGGSKDGGLIENKDYRLTGLPPVEGYYEHMFQVVTGYVKFVGQAYISNDVDTQGEVDEFCAKLLSKYIGIIV